MSRRRYKIARPIGPHSRRNLFAKLDGRTLEARLVRETREQLTAHVGGTPSATQRALIKRAAQLTLRLELMDKRFAETGAHTDYDSRIYLAWSNTLTRTLRSLGTKGVDPAAVPSLRGYLTERQAATP